MKKRVASVVLVSALGVGAVSTMALTPAIAATASSASHRLTDIENALKGLVSDGTLTQAQADKVASTLDKALPPPGGLRREARGLFRDAAGVLGMTPEQLRTAMGTTKSLADVAASKGISKADLVDKLLALLDQHLAADVKAGRLTQAQADSMKAEAQSHLSDAVSRVGLPAHPGGPDGDHDGPPPADGAAPSASDS